MTRRRLLRGMGVALAALGLAGAVVMLPGAEAVDGPVCACAAPHAWERDEARRRRARGVR